MGRGGGGRGRGGGGDKHGAFFAAIESEKLDTVRWSLVHGGILLTTCNENGETGLMVAASRGKAKSLEIMLEQIRRIRSAAERSECLDARDGEDKTALMMAAVGGRLECAKLLRDAGAKLDLKDEEGYTARARAEWAGKQAIVDMLGGKNEESCESEDEVSDGGVEGETAAQRRKRKKQQLQGGAMSCAALRNAKKAAESSMQDVGSDKEHPIESSAPVLQEVAVALQAAAEEERTSGSVKDIKMSLVRKESEQPPGLAVGSLDPALWRCGSHVRHLEIKWQLGLHVGSLDHIGALKRILHLVVQDSRLPALPEAVGELREMRSLEVDGNCLKSFPESMKSLSACLESISAARNELTSDCLSRLAPLEHLVTLKLDYNKLGDLGDLALDTKPHLVMLSVAHNKLADLPDDPWAHLTMLQHLNVSANKLSELPCEMGAMKEKKLTELVLHDNPWKDGKIRNMIENSAVLSNTVLVYLRKQKPKGRKQPKGKDKTRSKAASSDEDEQPPTTAPPPSTAGKKKGKSATKSAPAPAQDSDNDDSEDDETRRERLAAIEAAKQMEVEERRKAAAEKRAEKEELENKLRQKNIAAEQAREAAKLEKEERDAKKAEAAAQKAQEEAREMERRSRMTDEEIKAEEERAESEKRQHEQRLAECERERKETAAVQAEQNKAKLEQRERELKVDEAKFKFVFYGGQMHKVRIDGPTANAKGGNKNSSGSKGGGEVGGKTGGHGSGKGGGRGGQRGTGRKDEMNYEGSIDVPKDLLGRLIGKGGATIKDLCQSTGANINIPKDGSGDVVQVDIRGGKRAVDAAVERITGLLT